MKTIFKIPFLKIGIIGFIVLTFHILMAQELTELNILQTGTDFVTFRVDIPEIHLEKKIVQGEQYLMPTVPGYFTHLEPGGLPLPQKAFKFAAPPKGKVEVEIVSAELRNKTLAAPLPIIKSDATENDAKFENSFVRPGKIPSALPGHTQLVRVQEVGILRDRRIVSIVISPVQVAPDLQTFTVYGSLTLRLRFEQNQHAHLQLQSTSNNTSTFDAFFKKTIGNFSQSKSWRLSKSPNAYLANVFESFQEWYKIEVREDGLYEITGEDLQVAGIEIGVLNPQGIRLYNKGKEIPIFVWDGKDGGFDPEDKIVFRGAFNRGTTTYLSPYTRTNVYWLTWGEAVGLRFAEVDGGVYETDPSKLLHPKYFRSQEHFEEDRHFDRLLLVEDERADHWFWQPLHAFGAYSFGFRLQYPVASNTFATLRIALLGSTHPAANPDHHVRAFLNGAFVGEARWDGQQAYHLENSQVSAAILHHGDNVLELRVPADTEAGEIDQSFLNWFELEYDKSLQAVDDFLEVNWNTDAPVEMTATGFADSDIHIFDSRGRVIVNYELIRSDSGYSVKFQDRLQSPVTYFLFTPKACKKVNAISKDEPSHLKSPDKGADYLIITHTAFKPAIAPLVQHRTSQGLRVSTIDVENIYDEFSHGIYDPTAIKAFLKYAYHNWLAPAPTYVLLVGDHHWGFDKEIAHAWEKVSYVPSYMAYTRSWGVTSSDNYFVSVSGDDPLPDMFIGRLPVNSPAETETIVRKILDYESHPNFGEWRKKLGFSVGNRREFEQQAGVLINEYVPQDFNVEHLYTNPQSPYFGSTEDLLQIFNQGAAIMNFTGHGGGGVFADAELFLLEDIQLLDNAHRLPVAFSWSCFIGYFDDPFTPALGEELLRAPDHGIVAHFGAAGRAWVFGDAFFNQALFGSLFRRGRRILGQITTEAKVDLMANFSFYHDLVLNYNLLGDPALKIGLPEKQISLQIESPQDTLIIKGQLDEPVNGTVDLSFYNQSDSLLFREERQVVEGRFDYERARQNIPLNAQKVKAYFQNDMTDGSGVGYFTVQPVNFSEGYLLPPNPVHKDSVFFFMKLSQNDSAELLQIDSVLCKWSLDRELWWEIPMVRFNDGFKSLAPIIASEGRTLFFQFVAQSKQDSSQKNEIKSRIFSHYFAKRADLAISPKDVKIGGSENLLLIVSLHNRGETDAAAVAIHVYEISTDSRKLVARGIVPSIAAKSDTTIAIPWSSEFLPAGNEFEIVLDEENRINETSEFNNSVRKQSQFLTVRDGTGGTVLSPDGHFAVTVSPNSIARNTTFTLERLGVQDLQLAQSGLNPVVLPDSGAGIYEFALVDSNLIFQKPFLVAFNMGAMDSIGVAFAIYHFHEQSKTWTPLTVETNFQKSVVYRAQTSADGIYGLFEVQDKQPPSISMKVNGQWFADGDYVASQPQFSFVIEDSSGIALIDDKLKLVLDNRQVSRHEYAFGYTTIRPHVLMVNYAPNLISGAHRVSLAVADIHGNATESAVNFQISRDFQLVGLANHPNPFADETIFAYTLTDEAETVEINIYTIAGQLIRTFEYFNEMGYVEHTWDTSDESGNEIANGVYYMRFVARRGSERIERIQKLAKLK